MGQYFAMYVLTFTQIKRFNMNNLTDYERVIVLQMCKR